jgi:hypothetical protein
MAADEKRKIFQPIVDKRLFRTAKKSLLLALLHKIETIYNTVSQFVTTLRSTNGSNEYDVFYYCSLSLILIEVLLKLIIIRIIRHLLFDTYYSKLIIILRPFFCICYSFYFQFFVLLISSFNFHSNCRS